MYLNIIHHPISADNADCLLSSALNCRPIADIVLTALNSQNGQTVTALPDNWKVNVSQNHPDIISHQEIYSVEAKAENIIISNAKFATNIDFNQLKNLSANLDCDLITLDVDPSLMNYHETVRFTSNDQIAGFRRFYHNSTLPSTIPQDWPCHVIIRTDAWKKLKNVNFSTIGFPKFISQCKSANLSCRGLKIAGTALNLCTQTGLLEFTKTILNQVEGHLKKIQPSNKNISASAKFFGNVLVGDNVSIDDNAIVIGPTILCDNVRIASDAVIKVSVIGPNLAIPKKHFMENQFLLNSNQNLYQCSLTKFKLPTTQSFDPVSKKNNYRVWPLFSYVRLFKRTFDILVSLLVLVLFAPVFPIIAAAVKLNSRGPVFFGHKRQGLHGKEFSCLKFRTMITGADEIQDKLRSKNEVDGPQFKVDDDPRVTAVGKFLRNTFIDEIPQFINILLGHMSIIGPRPSPRRENSQCPTWYYARLSVRPGITGLWQICRTRLPGRDFQEWIYYDTKYVRELSLRLDAFIFWRTTMKLIMQFLRQF